MAEPAEALRQALSAESSAYVPDPELPRRIARRTLQLQRRRRSRIVGAVAVIAAAAIVLPLVVNPVLSRKNQVSVASYGPTPTTARRSTTTTSTLPPSIWALFIPSPAPSLPPGLAGLAEALKQGKKPTRAQLRRLERALRAAAAVQVLGATATRGFSDPSALSALAALAGVQVPSPITTTTRPGETATTATTAASTTTTTAPPPTTTTTTVPPVVPLSISGPGSVCAAVPTVFHAAGTYAAQVVWNNGQVGASATYTFPATPTTANVSASVNVGGTNSSQQISVQVVPTGTAPC